VRERGEERLGGAVLLSGKVGAARVGTGVGVGMGSARAGGLGSHGKTMGRLTEG